MHNVAVVNRRPRLKLIAPSASPLEAAAIVAALERFMRETAPPLAPPAPSPNAWVRAARLEAVGHAPHAPSPWGDPHPWG
jgi:hypothetical protein